MKPCSCWFALTALHDGHCCLRDGYDQTTNRVTCGHDDEGMRLWASATTAKGEQE